MKIGLLGYGYTASFFAQKLVHEGYEVWGTSRNVSALKYNKVRGLEIIDFNQAEIAALLRDTSGLLISVPPTELGQDPAIVALSHLLIANKHNIKWIGYLSSSSVYGDHDGRWVNETSACYLDALHAKNRFSAEKAWLALYESEKLPVMIFRLAGIYGDKRNALERLRAGKKVSIIKPNHYFSRIHVSDICEVLFRAMLSPMPGHIFNLADDYPCNTDEVDTFAAELLHIKQPGLINYQDAVLSPMAKAFYESNKRVSNAKLKKYLLPQLRYPTYKEGLQAILLGETSV